MDKSYIAPAVRSQHTLTNIYINTQTHTHIHTYTHMRAHTHTRTHIHTRAHTQTHLVVAAVEEGASSLIP